MNKLSENFSFCSEFVFVFETEVFKVGCFTFFVIPIFQSIPLLNGLKEKLSESIAPGRAQSLADILSSDEDDELLELDLDELINIYKSSDKFDKIIALSFAAQKHSKTVVMEAF